MATQFHRRSVILVSSFILLSALTWIPSCESAEGHFCYDDDDQTCSGPSYWGGSCNDDKSKEQSPIRLPRFCNPFSVLRGINLKLDSYKADSFILRNTGDTVSIKFPKQANSTNQVALGRLEGLQHTEYILDSAHFHWGRSNNVGSEHCTRNNCYSMELHLVHYLNKFDSVASALNTTERNTLAVIGIMFEATEGTDDNNAELNGVYQNLADVTKQSTEIQVNSPLDFGSLLSALPTEGVIYTYRGSLTTPNCNEKVDWFVAREPVSISPDTVEKFRKMQDFRGQPLQDNYRPLQPLNDRKVYCAVVRTA